MNRIGRLLIVMLFLIPSLVLASELVLKDGRVVDGKIIEQTPKYIKLDIDGGLGQMTYYFDEIDTVDGQKLQTAASPTAVEEQPVTQINSQAETTPNNDVQSQQTIQPQTPPSNDTSSNIENEAANNTSPQTIGSLSEGSLEDVQIKNKNLSKNNIEEFKEFYLEAMQARSAKDDLTEQNLLQKSLIYNPQSPEAYCNLCIIAQRGKPDYEEALGYCLKAVDLMPYANHDSDLQEKCEKRFYLPVKTF